MPHDDVYLGPTDEDADYGGRLEPEQPISRQPADQMTLKVGNNQLSIPVTGGSLPTLIYVVNVLLGFVALGNGAPWLVSIALVTGSSILFLIYLLVRARRRSSRVSELHIRGKVEVQHRIAGPRQPTPSDAGVKHSQPRS